LIRFMRSLDPQAGTRTVPINEPLSGLRRPLPAGRGEGQGEGAYLQPLLMTRPLAAPDRMARSGRRAALLGIALLSLALATALVHAQRVGSGKGIKFADYYDPPHETQMKWLLEGGSAQPVGSGRAVEVTDAKAQTFRDNGQGEIIVETPRCVYDSDQRLLNSSGLLRLRTADGSFSLEGEGFSWQQTNSVLFVSNRVHTTVYPELAGLQHGGARTNVPLPLASGMDIYADQFDYAEKTGRGVYRGNVRVVGTNLALTAESLVVLVPGTERRLQSFTAETNVVFRYGDIQATAQQANYAVDTGLVRLDGQPSWRQGPREGRGDQLLLDRTNAIFRADGHAWLKMPARSFGAVGFIPSTTAVRTNAPASTNEFAEVFCDAYELRTNSAVFSNQVRIMDRRDGQLKGKMDCSRMTIAFAGTNAVQKMLAEGPVVVEQETNRLECGVLTLTFAGTNELQQMIAQRDVVIAQETNRFTAGTAIYTATNGMLALTESPAWRSGSREGRGDLITVDVARQEMKVLTNAFVRLPAAEFGSVDASQPGALARLRTNVVAAAFAEVFAHDYTLQPEGAQFRGNVRLDHPQMRVRCGQVTALAPRGVGSTNTVVAEQAVVFDITDDKGEKIHGTGDQAVYTSAVSATQTNKTMVLTGNPAELIGTNFSGRNDTFILDLANHRLRAPGKSRYTVRDFIKTGVTNLNLMPDPTRLK
jgi:lipopolysaccharide export system protein LptA